MMINVKNEVRDPFICLKDQQKLNCWLTKLMMFQKIQVI